MRRPRLVSCFEGRKRCVRCDATKNADEFSVQQKSRDGLSSWCRECHRARALEIFREAEPPERSCLHCGASFVGRRRYCQQRCQRAYRRSLRLSGVQFSIRHDPKEVLEAVRLIHETKRVIRHRGTV